MVITVKSEYTGKKDYFAHDNILMKCLKDLGYKNIYLGFGEWDAQKWYLFGLIKINVEGEVSPAANEQLKYLSDNPWPVDTEIDLTI
ncbi:hypothetical protein Phi17218_178 [Cellulophaga phage phi17:2_18]|uniref:Uncharacterized protein n=2 Tax=Lightbulbvirus Cba172 TaxID=1918525 RepID=R9ZX64_9CAUD|nr:hypothetical protein Phi17:2_gp178 [Cellulophaga phage phi17:2]AGO47711.1 hypothetical protein Phi17:2_gp178 [Cellulophaga phage phi17:2]ALO80581.1 hypothetical protein Phi17218_178 [Cellulophaga phage phi17:2_18]